MEHEIIQQEVRKEIHKVTIRDYIVGEKIYTNEGFMLLPNNKFECKDLEENEIEDFEFDIAIFHNGRWIKTQNIDFE